MKKYFLAFFWFRKRKISVFQLRYAQQWQRARISRLNLSLGFFFINLMDCFLFVQGLGRCNVVFMGFKKNIYFDYYSRMKMNLTSCSLHFFSQHNPAGRNLKQKIIFQLNVTTRKPAKPFKLEDIEGDKIKYLNSNPNPNNIKSCDKHIITSKTKKTDKPQNKTENIWFCDINIFSFFSILPLP